MAAVAWRVSTELIRTSILWHEMWHGALEEASRLYFSQNDVQGMLDALMPLVPDAVVAHMLGGADGLAQLPSPTRRAARTRTTATIHRPWSCGFGCLAYLASCGC